jgi:hypothetical protein
LRILFTFLLLFIITNSFAQLVVKGTVLDKSKINYVEGVTVQTTSGKIALTDSLGKYSIQTKTGDSIFFSYNNKPTQKFAVNTIANNEQFDISLHIPVKSKYGLLKEVTVFSKSYKSDSIENRQTYAKVFNYKKPGIETTITPGGGVGIDANELINIFRFRRNKQLRKFQIWLEKEEQEKYVNYRFNKRFVGRVTQIKGAALDTFLVWYRPSYFFTSTSSDVEFNQYILDASYNYKRIIGDRRKLEARREERE